MKLENSILKTLAYHDVFNYPLKQEEIYKYLIGERTNLKKLQDTLSKLTYAKKITHKKGYFFLSGRAKLTALRTQRTKHSQRKLKRAFFYGTLLMLIPSVRMVAVSGALAMGNSHKNDDIDLVIVTSKGALWTTRFLTNILLFPYKRKPHSKSANDKACLNLYIDESNFKIKPQNLYTAHELAQLKILFDSKGTHQKLVKTNDWVRKFLPNWEPEISKNSKKAASPPNTRMPTLEILLKKIQLAYMKSKISTERIESTQLFFHPKDTQSWVLKEYKKKLLRLKLNPNL